MHQKLRNYRAIKEIRGLCLSSHLVYSITSKDIYHFFPPYNILIRPFLRRKPIILLIMYEF